MTQTFAHVRQVAVSTNPQAATSATTEGGAFGERYFLNLIAAPSAALAAASFMASAAPSLRPALGLFCHQIVSRSFCPDGRPMGLCARCTGIYLGVAGAWAGLAWLKRHPGVLRVLEPASYGIAALSVLLYIAGIDVANWPRFGLGLSFGLAAALALWRARQFVLWRRRRAVEEIR